MLTGETATLIVTCSEVLNITYIDRKRLRAEVPRDEY